MFAEDRVIYLKSNDKTGALRELVHSMEASPQLLDSQRFLDHILEREAIMSTGIGYGLAIPHAKVDAVNDFVVAVGIHKDGLDFDSFDKQPVHIIVMIGAGVHQKDEYLRVMARISKILKEEIYRKKILASENPKEILKLFSNP